jgi:translation initiation factor eIF-2B subunit gamma
MDGVVVGDGVQLTGCVVGRRARIEGLKPVETEAAVEGKGKGKKKEEDEEEKTRLVECEVAPNFVVKAGTEAKGEKMMAELEGMDDDDEGDEEYEEDEV